MDLVEGDDSHQIEICSGHKHPGVSLIQDLADYADFHSFGLRQVVVRHGEASLSLLEEHPFDAAADGIDHVEANHSFGQETILIDLRRSVSADGFFHASREKFTYICGSSLFSVGSRLGLYSNSC